MSFNKRHDFIEFLEERYQLNSNVIIFKRLPEKWHATINNNTLADVILDRLIHNAHSIELKVESICNRHAPIFDTSGWEMISG